eukprot:253746_1
MADTDDLSPDARDDRIAELEEQVTNLKATVNRQRETMSALQKTNQSLAQSLIEQLEKESEPSEPHEITSNTPKKQQRSSSIDVTLSNPSLTPKSICIYENNYRPKIGGLIKTKEIESSQRQSLKRQKDLIEKMTKEIENFKIKVSKLEQKQKEYCKKLKAYKSNEKFIKTNIEIMQHCQKKLDDNSLECLSSLYPDYSDKELFESCQKGCVDLLEEIYNNKTNNIRKYSSLSDASTGDIDSDCKMNKRNKSSKIYTNLNYLMECFNDLFRKHIKLTINYINLQQSHNDLVNDFKLLYKDVQLFKPVQSVGKQLESFW